MRKYYQLLPLSTCFISLITLQIYYQEYRRQLNISLQSGFKTNVSCSICYNTTASSDFFRSPNVPEIMPIFQQFGDKFYLFSSFLRSNEKYEMFTEKHHIIDTIVIGEAQVVSNIRCKIWLKNVRKPKTGRFTCKYVVHLPQGDFRLYIFRCSIKRNLGHPTRVSFYVNDYKINPLFTPVNKLFEVNNKRNLKEKPLKLAICVVPEETSLVSRESFREFLDFHQMVGINDFIIYDSMISEDIPKWLNSFGNKKLNIQYFPLNYPYVFSKSYGIIRSAVELDCISRYFDEKNKELYITHVVVLSWNEFLSPRGHTNVTEVINEYDPKKHLRTIVVQKILVCMNPDDVDTNSLVEHHVFRYLDKSPALIKSLDSVAMFDDIFNFNMSFRIVPSGYLAINKYVECTDPRGMAILMEAWIKHLKQFPTPMG